jgi:hypothetical protein
VYVVAAGACNHAGKSSWAGQSDLNSRAIGIEAESAGLGDWSKAQLDCYPRLVAACLHYMRRGPERLCAHRECAIPKGRKPDPTGIDMATMRATVGHYLTDPLRLIPRGGSTTSTPARPTGGFLMALSDAEQAEALALLRTLNTQITGDTDGAGPDGWGWPNWRYGPDKGKPITPIDMLRAGDQQLNSSLDLTDRPGGDVDNLFGHVLSMRAELRQLGVDLSQRLTAVETALANAGVDPDVVRNAFASAFGGGLTISGTAVPANLQKGI